MRMSRRPRSEVSRAIATRSNRWRSTSSTGSGCGGRGGMIATARTASAYWALPSCRSERLSWRFTRRFFTRRGGRSMTRIDPSGEAGHGECPVEDVGPDDLARCGAWQRLGAHQPPARHLEVGKPLPDEPGKVVGVHPRTTPGYDDGA